MTERATEGATADVPSATWIVVPAFREARAIGAVLRALRERGWRVVVVDDGSPDETAAVARDAGARVVRHPINLGQGAALRTGFAFALRDPSTRYVVTFDADGQHDPDAIARLIAPLATGDADVVLGSRFLDPEAVRAVPPGRRLLLRAATRVSRLTTGLPLTDAHNGFRAFTAPALARLRLLQDRMAHASEIQAAIARHGLRCVERPVTVRYTDYSLAKGQRFVDAVSILWDLLLAPGRSTR